MIKPKKPTECTTRVIKFCEEYKKIILDKQKELKELGARHGKDVVIKALLDELIQLRNETKTDNQALGD